MMRSCISASAARRSLPSSPLDRRVVSFGLLGPPPLPPPKDGRSRMSSHSRPLQAARPSVARELGCLGIDHRPVSNDGPLPPHRSSCHRGHLNRQGLGWNCRSSGRVACCGASVAGVVVAACEVPGGSYGENRPLKFGKTATKPPPRAFFRITANRSAVAKWLVINRLGGGR